MQLCFVDQALIRDWITQLAPSYENFVWANLGAVPGLGNTGVADDFNGDGISNGQEYAGIQIGSLASASGGSHFQGSLSFSASSTGLTLAIQMSENLELDSWVTVASRLRGQTSWRVSSGFSVSESSPGVIQFTDSTVGINKRFYRSSIVEE